jgi:hypothetical protein
MGSVRRYIEKRAKNGTTNDRTACAVRRRRKEHNERVSECAGKETERQWQRDAPDPVAVMGVGRGRRRN